MRAQYLEFLVEEPSMEALLKVMLPKILPEDCKFIIRTLKGKSDLLDRLESRLTGYRNWIPANYRVFVLVDRDQDDCKELKARLEGTMSNVKLLTRSKARGRAWQVVNRIVVEELEAWYFGDWEAVLKAYPRVSKAKIPRNPDDIKGGTKEKFEEVLQSKGYFKDGLQAREAALNIAAHADPERNTSPSFKAFYRALLEAIE